MYALETDSFTCTTRSSVYFPQLWLEQPLHPNGMYVYALPTPWKPNLVVDVEGEKTLYLKSTAAKGISIT